MLIGHKYNIAAFAAVATVGTTCIDIFFTVKRYGTIAALSGLNMNFGTAVRDFECYCSTA